MKFKKLAIVTLALGALSTGSASANNYVAYYANITGVVAADLFGGCMARTSPAPQTVAGLEACGNNFVTFDCQNTSGATNKTSANARYSNAQLAMVTGALSYITVDPANGAGGKCLAVQIETKPAP